MPETPLPSPEETMAEPQDTETHGDELLEMAWVIIANAGGGNWETQSDEWVTAAERWRDEFHATLKDIDE